MDRLICDSLECYSTAIAKSKVTGDVYCAACAVKISGQFGPENIETLEGAKFPWEYPADQICEHCGAKYNFYVTAHAGGCPSCKKSVRTLR